MDGIRVQFRIGAAKIEPPFVVVVVAVHQTLEWTNRCCCCCWCSNFPKIWSVVSAMRIRRRVYAAVRLRRFHSNSCHSSSAVDGAPLSSICVGDGGGTKWYWIRSGVIQCGGSRSCCSCCSCNKYCRAATAVRVARSRWWLSFWFVSRVVVGWLRSLRLWSNQLLSSS